MISSVWLIFKTRIKLHKDKNLNEIIHFYIADYINFHKIMLTRVEGLRTWSVGSSVKSSGGFVTTYRLDEASTDELVSRNLKQLDRYALFITYEWFVFNDSTCIDLYTTFRSCEEQPQKGLHIFPLHRTELKGHHTRRSDPLYNDLAHQAFPGY